MDLDKKIFKNMSLADLFEQIYDNSTRTRNQIRALISELRPLAGEDMAAAARLVPIIKEYLEIGVKNDEHLIKLATVVQRLESAAMKGGSGNDDLFGDLESILSQIQDDESAFHSKTPELPEHKDKTSKNKKPPKGTDS